MSESREWLIRKGGYFYRPKCFGYTTHKVEAGRYTRAEADREATERSGWSIAGTKGIQICLVQSTRRAIGPAMKA